MANEVWRSLWQPSDAGGYGAHAASTLSSMSTASRAFEPPGAQMSCGNEPKMRAKKESTGTEVETSTKYDETLRPHTRRSGRQSITRCEPLSYGKFHRSRWSAGCSRKKPLPSEAQKPTSTVRAGEAAVSNASI